MADIFISHATRDKKYVRALGEALEKVGWTVWWFEKIPTGAHYPDVLEKEFLAARAVVVLWSSRSIDSKYVLDEATRAAERGILFPVLIESVRIPEQFAAIQAAHLKEWISIPREEGFFENSLDPRPGIDSLRLAASPSFIGFKNTLQEHLGRPRRSFSRRSVAAMAVVAALIILTVAGYRIGWFARAPADETDAQVSVSLLPATGYIGGERQDASRVIVFVHGVLGNARDTWTASNGAYWPELLRKDETFKGSDVFVYDYPSPFYASSYTIDELADNLRLMLAAHAVFQKHDEVVFICHSMGGLIVRAFLLKYQSEQFASKVPMIYFLATPTTGSELSRLALLVKAQNAQFKDLLPWKDDAYAGNLVRNWLAAGFRIRSYCAYEKQPVAGLTETVVDPGSATGLCTKRLDPMERDHMNIVKPTDQNDLPYLAVKAAYSETMIQPLEDQRPR